MKLTRAASYAVHALVFMAAQKSNQPLASHNIAHARGIPERFLLKVLKPLVSVRILLLIKGPNGGYRLARAANEITLLDVLEAVDGPIRGQSSFAASATVWPPRLMVFASSFFAAVPKHSTRGTLFP